MFPSNTQTNVICKLAFVGMLGGIAGIAGGQELTDTKADVSSVLDWGANKSLNDPSETDSIRSLAEQYNAGVKASNDGRIGEAIEHFRPAMTSDDAELSFRARYNFGNCFHQLALQAIQAQVDAATAKADQGVAKPDEQDTPPDPREFLAHSVSAYRQSLRLKPTDENTRFNLEQAIRLLDLLNQQQQDQQQDQEQSPPNQDNQKSDDEDSSQDDSQQQPGQEGDEQSEQEQPNGQQDDSEGESSVTPNSANQSPQDTEDPGSGQESGSEDQSEPEEGDGESNSGEPSQQQNPGEQNSSNDPDSSNDQNDQAGESQNANSRDSNNQDDLSMSDGDGNNGELTAANQSDREDQSPDDRVIIQDDKQQSSMTPEEAQKMLQAIRDRDMLRRLRLEAMKRTRRFAVPKDW